MEWGQGRSGDTAILGADVQMFGVAVKHVGSHQAHSLNALGCEFCKTCRFDVISDPKDRIGSQVAGWGYRVVGARVRYGREAGWRK